MTHQFTAESLYPLNHTEAEENLQLKLSQQINTSKPSHLAAFLFIQCRFKVWSHIWKLKYERSSKIISFMLILKRIFSLHREKRNKSWKRETREKSSVDKGVDFLRFAEIVRLTLICQRASGLFVAASGSRSAGTRLSSGGSWHSRAVTSRKMARTNWGLSRTHSPSSN